MWENPDSQDPEETEYAWSPTMEDEIKEIVMGIVEDIIAKGGDERSLKRTPVDVMEPSGDVMSV